MRLPKFFGLLKKRRFIVRRIVGTSMAPTLTHGRLIIGLATQKFSTGDVVIVSHENLEKIKRIRRRTSDAIFVLGDNVTNSTDSRHFGWLPNTAVIAKVIWPRLNRQGMIDGEEAGE